ncbi:MAG: nucleotidyltransferase family protein [Clostridia bacterium]|nr:nucleotidyltransferase family protein [Clostridia bacterium]
MTTAFNELLYIYGDAIMGRKTNLPENCDRDAIAKKAMQHNVLPLVYFNIYGDETDNEYYPLVMQAVAINEKRMFFMKKLSSELTSEGIGHCVLKGSSLASLYPVPELRISGDIDILIDPKDEKKTMEFMKERNFVIKERAKGAQNFEARHQKAGLYEIHVQLFDSEFDKYVLRGKFKVNEPFDVMTNSDGTKINVLGKEDGFYFATSHMIKHFVKDGLGLRQISDWLLYFQKYSKELDMERFNKTIKELNFEKFINAMYCVGKKYFKMDISCEFEDPSNILSDMDEGGAFGHNDSDRLKYKTRLLDSLYGRSKVQKRKHQITRLFQIAFPGKSELIRKGFMKENDSIIFIPCAWVRRWVDILRRGKLENIHSVTGTLEIDEEKLKKRSNILRDFKFLKNKKGR